MAAWLASARTTWASASRLDASKPAVGFEYSGGLEALGPRTVARLPLSAAACSSIALCIVSEGFMS